MECTLAGKHIFIDPMERQKYVLLSTSIKNLSQKANSKQYEEKREAGKE